jgi:phosphohistidine phosphatase
MKTLLVMRHAQAVQGATVSDHERPLTESGVRDAQRMGRLFRGIRPMRVLSSTAIRALETAEVALQVAKLTVSIERTKQLYDSDTTRHLSVLNSVDISIDRLLIVGHNPALENLVAMLVRQQVVMKTGALALIAVPTNAWQDLHAELACSLVGHYYPSMLKRHVEPDQ